VSSPRIGFAGDRDIAVRVLDFMLGEGVEPVLLLVSAGRGASHAEELRARCGHLPAGRVLEGKSFRTDEGVAALEAANLDYLVGIHFPYYMPARVLASPRRGALNLHPGFLPYTRGWHTPSWAILEATPIGATFHFMTEEIDAGDIVAQRALEVGPGDTAHSLYARVKELEYEVFREAWPHLLSGQIPRAAQRGEGTVHDRSELLDPSVQRIDLNTPVAAGDLLRRLRALTTNRVEEAAYYEADGRRYRVRVEITAEAP
jgi:methionyl-tRNA formyltransferase